MPPSIFGNYAPQQGILGSAQGETPGWANTLGILSAGLKDAANSFQGQGDTDNLSKWQQMSQQRGLQQQLFAGLQSQDPAQRQQAYQMAALLGVDSKPFQQQQAAQALPQLLSSMQPRTENVAALQLDNGAATPAFDYKAPGMNLTDAIGASNSPELQAQYAPEIIKQQLEAQQKAKTTLSPQEAVAAGFRPDAVVQRDAFGGLNVAQASDVPSQGKLNSELWLKQNDPHLPIDRGNLAVSQGRLEFEKGKFAAGIPDDATLHDMATRFVGGDRQAAVGISRNPATAAAFQRMVSQVGQERGMSQGDISKSLQTFQAGTKAVQAFDTGKQGDTTRSLNVSVAHLNTLKDLGTALKNGDVTLINSAKQKFAEAFGVPAPTNFDAARAIVADEVAKGVIGGQTAQADREALAASLKRERSPQAINGAIGTFQDLLAGQLHGLRQQYKSSTGRDDFNDKLFPETVSVLDKAKPKQAGPPSPAALPRLPGATPAAKIRTFNPATGRLE